MQKIVNYHLETPEQLSVPVAYRLAVGALLAAPLPPHVAPSTDEPSNACLKHNSLMRRRLSYWIVICVICVIFDSNLLSPCRADQPANSAPAAVTALAFSPDGKHLAIGTFRQVVLYDTATWQPVATYRDVQDAVR